MKSSPSFLSALFCTFVVVACSSDDNSDPVEEPDPTTLAIAELRPSGGESWREGDAEPVVIGCDRLLTVALELENWTLRPRGACGSLEQCGYVHVKLSAGGASLDVDAALANVVLDLADLELTADAPATIRVELRGGTGEAFEQPAGEILADELSVALETTDSASCDAASGGAGGQSGSGEAGAGASEGGAAGASAGRPASEGGVAGETDAGAAGRGDDPGPAGGQGGQGGQGASGGAGGESGASTSGAGGEAGGV